MPAEKADALLSDEQLLAEAAETPSDDNMFDDMEENALADLDDALAGGDAAPADDAFDMAAPQKKAVVDDEDAPQETFSIRTRSMAEVLAEQGDIQGALEIYQELAQAAEGAEKDELSQRILTLQARLGGAVPTPAVEESPAKAPITGKEQVLSVLTSLAKGLESRAH